ncbi:MAG: hypothetical protein JNN08_29085, partial [Bryobacterales bacterium]|nr:hypothetical protein [Bryobacterales bacterium]
DFPTEEAIKTIDSMISSGSRVRFNYALLSNPAGAKIFRASWQRARGDVIEGINLVDSRRIKEEVGIPVLCTGGFQTASFIRAAIEGGACDAVTIARSFIANNDLPKIFAAGHDAPERPCTYCNKCLVNVLENPLGCYEQDRYPSREAMIAEILSVFDPPPFS